MKPRLRKDGNWWRCTGCFGMYRVIAEGRTFKEAYEAYRTHAMSIITGASNA